MNKEEFGRIMNTLNNSFGGYNPSIFDTWFLALGKYDYSSCSTAVWHLIETMKTKPRIADIREAMGKETVNGGNAVVDDFGCELCSGGWVMMEVEPGVMAGLRCICELGDRLNEKSARLTPEHIKARRINIRGELKYPNQKDMERENRIQNMTHEQKIAWCRKGMAQMESRW